MNQKIQIRVTDVIAMLEDGKSREEIGEHYGLNKSDIKALFSIPQLKGKRAKKQRPFQIIFDEADEVETTNEDLPQDEDLPQVPAPVEQTIEGTSTEQEAVENNIEVEENPQEDFSSSWEN